MLVERDITHLNIGAYVVDIVKQTGIFKIRQPGWVRDFEAINHLILQGVERVLIDTSKQLNEEGIPLDEAEASKVADSKADPTPHKDSPKRSRKSNFQRDISEAKALFEEAKKVQRKVFDDVQQGRPIDMAPVKLINERSIESIFENPDALACVINIRNKDEYLLEHSTSVSILMTMFARSLELNDETIEQLSIGGFLHDVGKIEIPDAILNKPGKLTIDEFEVMKTHVTHGITIVERAKDVAPLSREVIAMHHEKLDASGYPFGLDASELSRYARMISICDIFDALCAHRVYKKGIAQIRAFSILRELAEKNHLDGGLVNAFIKCMGVYPVGSLVLLTSNKLAIVESRNPHDPVRPKVKSFYSVQQHMFVAAKDIDLGVDSKIGIERGVRADDFEIDMNRILEFLLMVG